MTIESQPRCIRPARPAAVLPTLALANAGGYLVLALTAGTCVLLPGARGFAQLAVGLPLHAVLRPAPAPSLAGGLSLLAANARAAGWPLIPAALRADRFPGLRLIADLAVTLALAVNLLPVGAALGTYRLRLLPYLPQLPLELYALTTGAAAWWLCSRRQLDRRWLGLIAASMLAALAAAAALETWAVPHR